MAIVKVDDKGRIQLSKELRRTSSVQKNDRLIAKSVSKGKILLEKTTAEAKLNDPLDWL